MSDRHSTPSFPLRMPVELRQKLLTCADEKKRSLNAEILDRLQSTLEIDEAMQEGHPGADYSFAAGALAQLEVDIKEVQEENKSLQLMAYAEQMESMLGSVRYNQETTSLLLAVIASLVSGSALEKVDAKRLEKVIEHFSGLGADEKEAGNSPLSAIIRQLLVKAASESFGL